MRRLSVRLLLWLLLVSIPLSLSGNGSLVVLENPQGAVTTSSCASAACDITGEKERFDRDKVEQKVTSLPALIEENVTGLPSVTSLLAHIDAHSNSRNPAFPPHAFPGATLELGIEDLLFQIDEKYKFGIAITGHSGAVNGEPATRGVQASAPYNSTNGNAGVTTAAFVPQHTNRDIHRYDEPVGLSNPENKLVPEATGNVPGTGPRTGGPGATPGPDDFAPISFIPTEEFLTDPVGNEFEPTLSAAGPGNDVPSGSATGAVPEPGTLAVFALGLAGLVARRRRRAAT